MHINPTLTADQLNAIVRKMGGHDMGLRFLRGELSVFESSCSWREERNGIICFSVVSDGMTGKGWVERLESDGIWLGPGVREVLYSPDFRPTRGVTTKIGILKGMSFTDRRRTMRNIRAEAKRRGLFKPSAEVGCLIREQFTDEEIEAMGLQCIIVMHKPIDDPNGVPLLLSVSCDRDRGSTCIGTVHSRISSALLNHYDGFAFAVSSTSA